MKYIDEFRRTDLANKLAQAIKQEIQDTRSYRLMEFCGGHTHAIFRYGVQSLMPENVQFIHGPGCPVCVLPIARIDYALNLIQNEKIILCTYGDLMRVPASERKSLLKAKAEGADVRMILSTQDALVIAKEYPEKEVVFFAIGFETTTPPTAVAILQAYKSGLKNFSVFCNHVLTPAAVDAILTSAKQHEKQMSIEGILGPSHVSSIIGSKAYESIAREYEIPIVIAGFEPLDVMQSTLMLIRQINESRFEVENEYTRVVSREGNKKALDLMQQVFELRDSFEWRGLGFIANSALQINEKYQDFDCEKRFSITLSSSDEIKGCECPSILRGEKKPTDCKLFGTVCTPENPIGSCMVSSEGACAAYWSYGRFQSLQH